MRTACFVTLIAVALAALMLGQTQALTPEEDRDPKLDTPNLSVTTPKYPHRAVLQIRAGSKTGTPAGFTVHWMRYDKFVANGNKWYEEDDPRLYKASFVGKNMGLGGTSNYNLDKNETTFIEIGERLFDDAGVTTNWPVKLYYRTKYIYRVFANEAPGHKPSKYSGDRTGLTDPCSGQCITKTQGYWKNHPEAWPQEVIDNGLMLGNVNYTAQQLLDIFHTPAAGNGLISLSHQLIATKLNILAFGYPNDVDAAAAIINIIDDADDLIGDLVVPPVGNGHIDPSETSQLNNQLTNYNEFYDC